MEVRLERPALGGAVGHLPDGRVVFVRHGAIGERVDVRLESEAARFARGEAIAVLEPSEDRVPAPCSHARPDGCGGCDLQHLSAGAQRRWKSEVLSDQLRRLAHLEIEVEVEVAPSPARGSRVRLRCAVGDEGQLGLRRWRSHDLEELDDCYLVDPRLSSAFSATWPSGEVELRALGDGPAHAVWRPRPGGASRTMDLRGRPVPTMPARVEVAGHVFDVSAESFWQSHRDAPSLLTTTVMGMADPRRGESAFDLFSGVGLFSAPLAQAVGPRGRVVALESSTSAVADARRNLEGLPARVRHQPVTPATAAVIDAGALVVLDPPRSGLARQVPEAIAGRAPSRVVYVSCDAATFARDLSRFATSGYRLVTLRAFDLFPFTEHVELVGLLDRRP